MTVWTAVASVISRTPGERETRSATIGPSSLPPSGGSPPRNRREETAEERCEAQIERRLERRTAWTGLESATIGPSSPPPSDGSPPRNRREVDRRPRRERVQSSRSFAAAGLHSWESGEARVWLYSKPALEEVERASFQPVFRSSESERAISPRPTQVQAVQSRSMASRSMQAGQVEDSSCRTRHTTPKDGC